MNVSDIPSPSPETARHQQGALATRAAAKADRARSKSAPRFSALRRRRLQLARYLRLIASLRDEADEMRAEISSLEFIIGAQAETIAALRAQKNRRD